MTVDIQRESFPAFLPTLFEGPSYLSLFDRVPATILKKGEVVFSGANANQYIYLVTKGMVKTYSFHNGREMLEDYFLKDELFNCDVLFAASRSDIVAEAMTQMTTIKKIPIEKFRREMVANVTLYRDVMKSISASLSRSQERLRRITLLNSRHRVIHFLANHVKKAGRQVGYEFVVKPAITHQEVGNISGTSRQTATTVLNELRKKGIIHFNRSYLIVRDLDALLKMAGE